MGRAKNAMIENEDNGNLIEFLEELLRQDVFTGALSGIAKQVIDKGEDSMNDKQRAVVERFVKNYKQQNECERCGNGNISSLTDYIFISENGLCPMCEHDREKFMRD